MKKETETGVEAQRPKRLDMFSLRFDQIQIQDGFNARYDMGELKELGEQILSAGRILQPLKGYKDGQTPDGRPVYTISDGHRRIAAYMLVADKLPEDFEIPLRPEPRGYTDKDRTIDLIRSNEGKPLTMLEEAIVVQRLMTEHGMTVAEVVKTIGKTKMHVSNLVTLMKAKPALHKQIRDGKVTATTVIEMLKQEPAEQVEQDVETAIAAKNKPDGKVKVSKTDVAKAATERKKNLPETSLTKQEQKENRAAAPKVIQETDRERLDKLIKVLEKASGSKKSPALLALKATYDWLNGTKKADELHKFYLTD